MKSYFLIVLFLFLPSSISADIAPSSYNGLSIVPAENTEISMLEETVDIFVLDEGNARPFRYLCNVKAEFIMENGTDHSIEIMVGFPVELYSGKLDLYARNVLVKDDIYNFKVTSNGTQIDSVSASVVNGSFKYSRPDDYLWFGWRQAFKPGTTKILVEYSFVTTPVTGFNATQIGYSLYSGSFWKGPIGKAVVRINYPGQMSDEFISGFNPDEYTIEEDKVVWNFEEFEPDAKDNILLEFIPFELIYEIEAARKKYRSAPYDLAAKRDLAVAYLGLMRTRNKGYVARLINWDDTTYMEEAERLIREILDENPSDCYVWNLYLSHYFKMHPGALGPYGIRPANKLSVIQNDLIDEAFEHCPADTGISLWKDLRDKSGPDFRDAVRYVEEAGQHLTVTIVHPRSGGIVGIGMTPHEREVIYLMYQPIDTVRTETYVMHNVKAEHRKISLKPRSTQVSDDVRASIREIVDWDYQLYGLISSKIREYNYRTGIYRSQDTK